MPDDSSPENAWTPIDRPLLRSDLNDVRETVQSMNTMLLKWYEENKVWRRQSEALAEHVDGLAKHVSRIEQRLWLPTAVSAVLLLLTALAGLASR